MQFKTVLFSAFTAFLLVISCCLYIPSIHQAIARYTITQIEKQFGAQSIPVDQEQKVRDVAARMGIIDDILIRRMNDTAMSTFGYHNAFFIASNLWNILPITDTPFIYISAGFFEDVSEAEQQFLIGHELIHLKERHNRFLPLIYLGAIILLLIICCVFLLAPIVHFFNALRARWPEPVELSYAITALQACLMMGILYSCYTLPLLSAYAYKRHNEWRADMQSVALLNTYDGGVLVVDRCVKELNQAAQWDFWQGLLLDHPSNKDRKDYFLAQKKQSSTLS